MAVNLSKTRATYAFAERQFFLMKRYWMWEMVFVVYTLSMTLSIGFLGTGVTSLTGQPAADTSRLVLFLLTGSLLWGYLSALFWDVSNIISWERWEGTIEYTFMAPVERWTHIVGVSIASILYGLVRTSLLLFLVAVFFKIDLSNANFMGAFSVLAVSSISFIGLGTVVAVLPLLSPEKGAQMTGIVEGLLLLLSGVYYETSVLPEWMQPLSALSPATYCLRGIREALLEGKGVTELGHIFIPLIIMGVLLIPIGFWIFGLGEKHCKRTGKLKRSG